MLSARRRARRCSASRAGVVLTAQPAPSPRDVRERAWQANNLGVAYLEQFNYAKAATQFEAALAIDRGLVPARVNLAIARMYEPDLPAAVKAATAAAAAPSAPPHADFVLGLIAAPRIARRTRCRVPARAPGRSRRRRVAREPGQLLLQQRAYAEAVPLFGKAVELEPYNVSALYNLASRRRGPASANSGPRRRRSSRPCARRATAPRTRTRTWSRAATQRRSCRRAPNPTWPPRRTPAADLHDGTRVSLSHRERSQPPQALARRPQSGRRPSTSSSLAHRGSTCTARRAVPPTRTVPQQRPTWPMPPASTRAGSSSPTCDNDEQARPPAARPRWSGAVAPGRGRRWHAFDFTDVTKASGISTPLDVRTAALVDLDHDGDVDLVLGGATRDGGAEAPLVAWRNNGDGTFADISTTALPGRRRRLSRAPSCPPTWTFAATSTSLCSATTGASASGATCETRRSAR